MKPCHFSFPPVEGAHSLLRSELGFVKSDLLSVWVPVAIIFYLWLQIKEFIFIYLFFLSQLFWKVLRASKDRQIIVFYFDWYCSLPQPQCDWGLYIRSGVSAGEPVLIHHLFVLVFHIDEWQLWLEIHVLVDQAFRVFGECFPIQSNTICSAMVHRIVWSVGRYCTYGFCSTLLSNITHSQRCIMINLSLSCFHPKMMVYRTPRVTFVIRQFLKMCLWVDCCEFWWIVTSASFFVQDLAATLGNDLPLSSTTKSHMVCFVKMATPTASHMHLFVVE